MKKFMVLVIAALLSQGAMAANLSCTGKILNLRITNFNRVYILPDWHSSVHIAICDVDGGWKAIPALVCQQWLASLQSAMHLNKDVLVNYTDTAAASCAAMPTYSEAEAPYLIQFYK